MPLYSYICKCGYAYEQRKRISEDYPSECPKCHCGYGQGFGLNYSAGAVEVYVKGCHTWGQQAEHNARELGRDKMQELGLAETPEGKRAAVENAPWWRPGTTKPLDFSQCQDLQKYIETGEGNVK